MNTISNEEISKNDNNSDIAKIIGEIKDFKIPEEPQKEDQKSHELVYMFIGDSKYSPKVANNAQSFGIYETYGFSEVAFICNKHTLPFYSIVSILCGSMDKAAKLVNEIITNNLQDSFAKYLWHEKRVILVNKSEQKQKIDDFLSYHPKHCLFICGKKLLIMKKYNHVDCSYTNVRLEGKKIRKYDYIFKTSHPSSHAYPKNPERCCKTYLLLEYQDPNSSLKISDFKRL